MVLKILESVVVLYVVLACVTFYNYKHPIQLFGYQAPTSFYIWEWFAFGPIILMVMGVCFCLVGAILLSPILLFLIGMKWTAILSLFILFYLTRFASLIRLNGVVLKFGFPLDNIIGIVVFLILGTAYSIMGILFLSPLLFLIWLL